MLFVRLVIPYKGLQSSWDGRRRIHRLVVMRADGRDVAVEDDSTTDGVDVANTFAQWAVENDFCRECHRYSCAEDHHAAPAVEPLPERPARNATGDGVAFPLIRGSSVMSSAKAGQAACRQMRIPLDWFFSRNPHQQRSAKAICARCPIREPCLQEALDDEEIVGVWGGTSTGERIRMRRTRAVA